MGNAFPTGLTVVSGPSGVHAVVAVSEVFARGAPTWLAVQLQKPSQGATVTS